MFHNAAANKVGPASQSYHYQRHQPEQTLLYQIIEKHYPAFTTHLAQQGIELPGFILPLPPDGKAHWSDVKTTYEVTIDRPIEDVFAVLAAVERYHEWLPPSETFVRTELADDEPIKQGATYIDYQTKGVQMPGSVHLYQPPTRIGFSQQLSLPLGARVFVTMEYTLTSDGNGTHVLREYVFRMPLLLRPMERVLKGKILEENDRIVAALKRALET